MQTIRAGNSCRKQGGVARSTGGGQCGGLPIMFTEDETGEGGAVD